MKILRFSLFVICIQGMSLLSNVESVSDKECNTEIIKDIILSDSAFNLDNYSTILDEEPKFIKKSFLYFLEHKKIESLKSNKKTELDLIEYLNDCKDSYIPLKLSIKDNIYALNANGIGEQYFNGEKGMGFPERNEFLHSKCDKDHIDEYVTLSSYRYKFNVCFVSFIPEKSYGSYKYLKILYLVNNILLSEEFYFVTKNNKYFAYIQEVDDMKNSIIEKIAVAKNDEDKIKLVNEYQSFFLKKDVYNENDLSLFTFKKDVSLELALKLNKVMFLFQRSNSENIKQKPLDFDLISKAYLNLNILLNVENYFVGDSLCFLYGYNNEMFGMSIAPLSILNTRPILEELYLLYNSCILYNKSKGGSVEEQNYLRKIDSLASKLILDLKELDIKEPVSD